MTTYTATVRWLRNDAAFSDGRYSRAHQWAFDGGALVPASAGPAHVPPGTANPAGVDPEEAFVASLSSCHMLFFLYFAQRAGLVVDSYTDEADGELGKLDGKDAMIRVTLHPRIEWAGDPPSADQLAELHHQAHGACFIANSVKTEVVVEL